MIASPKSKNKIMLQPLKTKKKPLAVVCAMFDLRANLASRLVCHVILAKSTFNMNSCQLHNPYEFWSNP
jgi:hypothetical protein